MPTFKAKRNTYTQLLQQQEIRNMEQNRLWNNDKNKHIVWVRIFTEMFFNRMYIYFIYAF